MFSSKESLSITTLENNWILYRLTGVIKTILWNKKIHNQNINVEKICEHQYASIKDIIDRKWLDHICDEIGCTSRMVVIDENEKLYRYCCSEPIEKYVGNFGECKADV